MTLLRVLLALGLAVVGGCGEPSDETEDRRQRRAYDGAPPVIAHEAFGASCDACHAEGGVEPPGLGPAPASPHRETAGMSAARCEQCHVYRTTGASFVATEFEGRRRTGPAHRRYPSAPPVLPHPVFMREDCLACHAGAAAREAIRTTHPERTRCLQCHVESRTTGTFPSGE